MKSVVLMTALVAGVALIAAPAEAAKKQKNAPVKRPAVASTPHYPNAVYAYDGDLLGADPDSFIRMMLIREGKPRDQSGI